MFKLVVQSFLETHSANELAAQHGIYVRPAADGVALSCNYDQIDSKESDSMTWECRGLVLAREMGELYLNLDEVVGRTIVLASPFKRFFNLGTVNAANLDMSHAVFMEKVDGTLGILYFNQFKQAWHLATRSIPEADRPITFGGFGTVNHTFRTLFETCLLATANCDFDTYTSNLDKEYTYMFEILSPINQIVVRHSDNKLVLIGIRSSLTGQEKCLPTNLFGVPAVRTYNFHDTTSAITYINQFMASELEGLVVRDDQFNRVKIKTAAYLAAARIKASANSPRSILELILIGKTDDARLILAPMFIEVMDTLTSDFNALCKSEDALYAELTKDMPSRKDLALRLTNLNHPIGPCMDRFTGKSSSFRNWVANHSNKDGTYSNGFLDTMLGWMESK